LNDAITYPEKSGNKSNKLENDQSFKGDFKLENEYQNGKNICKVRKD
jgi:hypothetical protein